MRSCHFIKNDQPVFALFPIVLGQTIFLFVYQSRQSVTIDDWLINTIWNDLNKN